MLAECSSSKRTLSSPKCSPHEQETYELPDYNSKGPVRRLPSFGHAWLDGFLNSHPKVRKVWLYIRGPRPKADLPGMPAP